MYQAANSRGFLFLAIGAKPPSLGSDGAVHANSPSASLSSQDDHEILAYLVQNYLLSPKLFF